MYYGQPWGAFGDPDKHVASLEVEQTASGAKVRIKASPNLGDAYYQVYVNNVFAGAVWCPEGLTSDWISVIVPGTGSASIVVFRIGGQPSFDNSLWASLDEEAPQQVTANWVWGYEVLDTPDNLELTSWALTGLKRAQVVPDPKVTRGTIPVTVTVDTGIATVTVGTICQGSGAVGGAVTLDQINGSGVSGSVTVDALAIDGTGTLNVRWPSSMAILRDQTDPPTTTVINVPYDGNDNGSTVDQAILSAGTYYYAFQPTSDTDDLGDKSTSTEIVVTGAPIAPTGLAYSSGDATATVINWTASTTPGATYNIYVQNPDDDYLDTTTPTLTAPAGSTSATLPAITGLPGTVQVIVRAELGGIEELNGDTLRIEYTSGSAYVLPRPNTPSITSISVADGLSITVRGNYSPEGEEASPDDLQLFIRDTDGVYDFGAPVDASPLGTEVFNYRTATLTYTLTDGWYYCTLKALTSAGQQSANAAPELLFYVSNDNLPAPTGSFTLSRG